MFESHLSTLGQIILEWEAGEIHSSAEAIGKLYYFFDVNTWY